MVFSLFFPCSVWGGREPTAALAERTRDESRQTFRLGGYPIRQAIAHTEQAVLFGFYLIHNVFFLRQSLASSRRQRGRVLLAGRSCGLPRSSPRCRRGRE